MKIPSYPILAILLLLLIIMDCHFPRFARIICFLPYQDLLVRIGCSITIYSRVSLSFPFLIIHFPFRTLFTDPRPIFFLSGHDITTTFNVIATILACPLHLNLNSSLSKVLSSYGLSPFLLSSILRPSSLSLLLHS